MPIRIPKPGRPAREALTCHVGAMRDWQAGGHEWHRKTTRYTDSELRRTHLGFILHPTGLGTAAVRVSTSVR
jgi:germacradienol/geosmin synthase